MLEIDSVDAAYGAIKVLHDISLTVDDGQLVALLGRNGAGKTTTVRSVMGLVPDVDGRITFKGREIQDLEPNETSKLGISLIPEERRLFAKLTVRENLEMGNISHGSVDDVDERIEEMFEFFPKLEAFQNRKARQLSGGEQQMVSIARGLMPEPDLLLVDEPTEGLMPTLVTKFRDDLSRINEQGTSMLLVEQNAELALEISDYAYVIDEGVIVTEGPSYEMREREDVKEKYLSI